MERITQNNLRVLVARMSRSMGVPDGPVWTRDADGRNRATVGVLRLEPGSQANGISWAIAQIMNDAGGQRTITRGSTARELWDVTQAWLEGYDFAKRS
jgi:hypothetical protein